MDEIRLTRRGESVAAHWLPVTRGVRRHAEAEDAFVAELRAWQEALPEEARFTHLTGARLRDWWLPPLPEGVPVFVSASPATRIRRAGLRASRRRGLQPAAQVKGLRVDSAAAILAACAADLRVLDLTCLIDAARKAGEVTPEELVAVASPGMKGRSRLLLAVSRSHSKADSIYEVLLRELHRSVEIEVEPQHEVLDAGNLVAQGDLWLVGTLYLHEYDGGDHLERRQQRKDRKRDIRVGNAGWQRRAYTRDDVLHQGVTILRDADAALGREHDPSRIRAWHALLRESTFTPAGLARLEHQLGIGSSGHSETS